MRKESPQVNVSVTFRHTESTPALKSYAIEKISNATQKYITGEADANVILLVEKRDHIAEVRVHAKGYDLSAKASTADLYSAIDEVIDNLEVQLRKQKERLKEHKGQAPISEVVS